MITPLEIQNKVFVKGMRGYKEEEVDRFLDIITEDLTVLLNQNEELENKVKTLESEIEKRNNTETCLAETLETARDLMADISIRSEKRAELVLENAKIEAEKIVQAAKDEAEKYYIDLNRIKRKISEFNKEYKGLLESEIKKFDNLVDGIEFESEDPNLIL